ncbi:hypothetical protein BRADI_4g32023v3 [Brachypodium distachyon]|uniref:Uncharacterized protein n=1 Tax=Brachypodium distachyon TaxID=15368 RepID=A0A2K2CRQ9_BRADI|nr:hypothetical protein BRADI_4g32023v3 [Brachypodium distachyon]
MTHQLGLFGHLSRSLRLTEKRIEEETAVAGKRKRGPAVAAPEGQRGRAWLQLLARSGLIFRLP